jgi:Asp-tRNA(Asn)/Glu-tRNA(Gln) amidotransferase A subunit family amidase
MLALIKLMLSRPFIEMQLRSTESGFPYIALPSRIRCMARSSSPWAGLRVAVKDHYHLKDVRTSFGSRAFYNTFPPQPHTSTCVQKLIDRGAVILGKLKMNSLGVWEEPTEYIDYQAPWNPRADGFQSFGGSSTGPACALAAYDFLDITLGSDSKYVRYQGTESAHTKQHQEVL